MAGGAAIDGSEVPVKTMNCAPAPTVLGATQWAAVRTTCGEMTSPVHSEPRPAGRGPARTPGRRWVAVVDGAVDDRLRRDAVDGRARLQAASGKQRQGRAAGQPDHKRGHARMIRIYAASQDARSAVGRALGEVDHRRSCSGSSSPKRRSSARSHSRSTATSSARADASRDLARHFDALVGCQPQEQRRQIDP